MNCTPRFRSWFLPALLLALSWEVEGPLGGTQPGWRKYASRVFIQPWQLPSFYGPGFPSLWLSFTLCLSTFLMLQTISIPPGVVVTPNQNIILLLFHNCNVVTVMNHNVNTYLCFLTVLGEPGEGVVTHRLRMAATERASATFFRVACYFDLCNHQWSQCYIL